MQKFNGSLIRQFPSLVTGNAADGVQVTVYVSGTNTLATIYEDNEVTPKGNPVTTSSNGFYSFKAADGKYRLQFSNSQFPALEIQLVDALDLVNAFNVAIDATAYVLVDSAFSGGYTVTQRNEALLDGGIYYVWKGALPKAIAAGSSVATTGGIGNGAWQAVLDNTLEQRLVAGTAPIGSVTSKDVSDLVEGIADGSAMVAGQTAQSVADLRGDLADGTADVGGAKSADLAKATINVPNLKSLASIPLADRRPDVIYHPVEFNNNTNIGGFGLRYDADYEWTSAQIGEVYPDLALNAWNGTAAGIATLYADYGSGTGAWVRVDASDLKLIDFGCIGDFGVGDTDNTVAFKRFISFIQSNRYTSYNNRGKFLISQKLDFKATHGWGIIGSNPQEFHIIQATNNTPILDLGSIAQDSLFAYELRNMSLSYSNVQPSTNTNANPIKFSEMGFQGILHNIRFLRGSWAIKVASGIGGPWGQDWDNLVFTSGLTGGAMDWTGAVNAVPNNKWGRFLVECQNMGGPVFKNIKGYNWTLDTLELLSATNCQWFEFQAGAELWIGALKCEVFSYSGTLAFSGSALIYAPICSLRIEQIHLGGTVATLNTENPLNLITSLTGSVDVGFLNTQLTAAPTNFFLSSASGGSVEIKYNKRGTYPVSNYTNIASTASSEFVTVYPDKNDKLSGNKGDSDYTLSSGDPSVITYQTPLTAVRTVNLPSGNTCFNGLVYKIISNGAVNGANTIEVRSNGVLKGALSADRTFVEFTWRRNATPHNGWVITASGAIS